MYNSSKADEIYRRKLEKDPNFDKKLVEKWKEEMPEEYSKFMYRQEYGNHIGDKNMYDDFVKKLKWANGKGEGAKWDAEELAQKSGIDFDEEGYTPYDYAYATNRLYSEYNNVFTEPSYYMKMAKEYLRSKNYPFRPQERAYRDAEMTSMRYNYNYNQNAYNRYDYDNNYNRGNYNYENRRGYDRRADRDNDGRYNEGR